MSSQLKNQANANPDFDGVLDVTPESVKDLLSQITLIDVRRPDEYEGELGHIQNAKLLVLDTLPERFEEIPKEGDVVLICRSGRRSAQASEFLQEQGYGNTFNLQGGMLLWNEKEFPVIGNE